MGAFEKLSRKHGDRVFEHLMSDLRKRGWSQKKLSTRLASAGVDVAQTTLSDISIGKNKKPNYYLGNALRQLWESGEQAPEESQTETARPA